jgi:hypothetical protein
VDLMYYYVKLPLVTAFAFFFVDRAHRWRARLPGGGDVSVGAVLAALLPASALALAAWVL